MATRHIRAHCAVDGQGEKLLERAMSNITLGRYKTTLFKEIIAQAAWDHPVLRIGPQIRIGYYAQEHETLTPERTILGELQQLPGVTRDRAFGVLNRFLFGWEDMDRIVEVDTPGLREYAGSFSYFWQKRKTSPFSSSRRKKRQPARKKAPAPPTSNFKDAQETEAKIEALTLGRAIPALGAGPGHQDPVDAHVANEVTGGEPLFLNTPLDGLDGRYGFAVERRDFVDVVHESLSSVGIFRQDAL